MIEKCDKIKGFSVLSVDGKVSCGSARKETADGKVKALQTLNVYSGDYGICLAQKFIEEKQMRYRRLRRSCA